jgi:hypothetical protein
LNQEPDIKSIVVPNLIHDTAINSNKEKIIDFKSDNFIDTFENFNSINETNNEPNNKINNEIEAYDGFDGFSLF